MKRPTTIRRASESRGELVPLSVYRAKGIDTYSNSTGSGDRSRMRSVPASKLLNRHAAVPVPGACRLEKKKSCASPRDVKKGRKLQGKSVMRRGRGAAWPGPRSRHPIQPSRGRAAPCRRRARLPHRVNPSSSPHPARPGPRVFSPLPPPCPLTFPAPNSKASLPVSPFLV